MPHLIRPALVLAVLMAALVGAPSTQAKLVYTCGFDICTSTDTGARQAKLTRNGTRQRPYSFPTVSRNGAVIAFARQDRIWVKRGRRAAVDQLRSYWGMPVGYLRLNAQGTKLMWNEFYASLDWNMNYTTRSYTTVVSSTARRLPEGSTREVWNAHTGFAPSGKPVSGDSFNQRACEWIAKPGECGRMVAIIPEPVGSQMLSGIGEFSPNGRLYASAVLAGSGARSTSRIAIFNARSGAFQRWLTRGPKDDDPTFSPDGRKVAYTCGTSICTINVNGTGKRVVVRRGTYPGWARG